MELRITVTFATPLLPANGQDLSVAGVIEGEGVGGPRGATQPYSLEYTNIGDLVNSLEKLYVTDIESQNIILFPDF